MNQEKYSLIDTHTHLYFGQFEKDIDQVIERARQAGLQAIITVGIDLDTSRKCIELAETYPDVFAAVGIHPNDSTKFEDSTIEQLKKLSQHPKVVAIGEIGLDYYRDWAPVEIQQEAFRQQIRLAREIGLPIIIHNREALEDILKILKSEGTEGLQGVFHCFSNNREWAQQVLD
ncbi:MAG: TatD family deoxyribonuclease, partial [Calditrichaeota bacterium]